MVQRWKPDTCSCIILEESGTSAYLSHEFVCPAHQGLNSSLLATVPLNDNKRKNQVYSAFLTNLTSDMADTAADGTLTLKNGIKLNFAWSGTGESRVITVTISGVSLTNAKKNTIRTWCDTNFGVGKVTIA